MLSSRSSERKKSFYRRVSVHHFHVMKDQMACCCCVPLGMAHHIIGCIDIVNFIFEIIQAMEYRAASNDEMIAI
jgi:hypothetical protein